MNSHILTEANIWSWIYAEFWLGLYFPVRQRKLMFPHHIWKSTLMTSNLKVAYEEIPGKIWIFETLNWLAVNRPKRRVWCFSDKIISPIRSVILCPANWIRRRWLEKTILVVNLKTTTYDGLISKILWRTKGEYTYSTHDAGDVVG